MSNFITVDNFKVNNFYRFPKELMEGKYSKMRLESKMTYAIFLDRVSLSIENGWCNEKGEIFVKIRRKVLMNLLSVRGTQKMSMIMEELSSCGLIEEKQCGFGRCNEIYLYNLEKTNDLNSSNNLNFNEDIRPSDKKVKKEIKGIGVKKMTFENRISKLLKSKLVSFDFKRENKTNINKTKVKETNNTKAFEYKTIRVRAVKIKAFMIRKL